MSHGCLCVLETKARQRACGVVEQIGYRGLLDTPLDKAFGPWGLRFR